MFQDKTTRMKLQARSVRPEGKKQEPDKQEGKILVKAEGKTYADLLKQIKRSEHRKKVNRIRKTVKGDM